jgi:hypothetical protein
MRRRSIAARRDGRAVAIGFGTVAAVVVGCLQSSDSSRRQPAAPTFDVDRPEFATCPRDAAREHSGRCACREGTVAVLGACVDPAVGDSFCGPAGRIGGAGCEFRVCSNSEALDLTTGSCLAVHRRIIGGPLACGIDAIPVLAGGQESCVLRRATCPRGTNRVADSCVRGPRCPPGTLPEESACRPVLARRTLDVGAWVSLALGIDGGFGSPELCRPLEQDPRIFGARPGTPVPLEIAIALSVPNQDVTRVRADVRARGGHEPLAPAAEHLVRAAVDTLIELLRGLGGETNAASADIRVRCLIVAGDATGTVDPSSGPDAPAQTSLKKRQTTGQ